MQYCLRNQENLCISARDWLLIRPQTVRDSIRDSIQIQIVAADSIRDSIRTKISDSHVPIDKCNLLYLVVFCFCVLHGSCLVVGTSAVD